MPLPRSRRVPGSGTGAAADGNGCETVGGVGPSPSSGSSIRGLSADGLPSPDPVTNGGFTPPGATGPPGGGPGKPPGGESERSAGGELPGAFSNTEAPIGITGKNRKGPFSTMPVSTSPTNAPPTTAG